MKRWNGDEASFAFVMQRWLDQVKDTIWPAWENGAWTGGATARMEAETVTELNLAVELHHGTGKDDSMLDRIPDVPAAPDGRRFDHRWHYQIEDAFVHDFRNAIEAGLTGTEPSFDYKSSRSIASNYLVYDPTIDISTFDGLAGLFWAEISARQPAIFDIKNLLQRPRPWTAAAALGVNGFRWETADSITHTGVHPSLLSGHCIQGILGGCGYVETLLDAGAVIDPARRRAIQKYMVDWGDRRVFAGVHYMTDNIGSWTLARRLIPHLFRHAPEIEALAVEAITQHSKVFSDIVERFAPDSPARAMFLADFPEAVPVS
jgi:hypothetical protein